MFKSWGGYQLISRAATALERVGRHFNINSAHLCAAAFLSRLVSWLDRVHSRGGEKRGLSLQL